MHIYSAFGLTISSDLPIPEFPPSEESPDVFFKFGSITPPEIHLDCPDHTLEGDLGRSDTSKLEKNIRAIFGGQEFRDD